MLFYIVQVCWESTAVGDCYHGIVWSELFWFHLNQIPIAANIWSHQSPDIHQSRYVACWRHSFNATIERTFGERFTWGTISLCMASDGNLLRVLFFFYWATKKKYDACIERKAEVHNHSPNEDTTLLNEFLPIYLLLCSSLCNYLPICMPLLFSLSHTYCTEFCEGKTKQLYSWVLNMSEHLPQV